MSFDPNLVRNESDVEGKLIAGYLLPKLGYRATDWHQQVVLHGARLDFLMFANDVTSFVVDVASLPSVVVEAKGPDQNLNKHVGQLRRYLNGTGVRYGLLTNGREIRIYERNEQRLKLRLRCDVRDLDEHLETAKTLIGKDDLLRRSRVSLDEAAPPKPSPSREKRKKRMKTIAIYHNKGGVGKTTVAINLAAALRRRGNDVLLVDLDSQANSTFATGLVKFRSEEEDNIRDSNVFHVLESRDFGRIPDVARRSVSFNTPEIDVVPAHIMMMDWQDRLTSLAASRYRLAIKLEQVKSQYDYVIVDAPPSRDLYAAVAMITADYLLVPSDLKPFANQGLANVVDFLQRNSDAREIAGKKPTELLGILPSKIMTNARYRQYTLPGQKQAITEKYDLPIMETMISELTALSACGNYTIMMDDVEIPAPRSIFEHEADSPSAEEFNALADEVLVKTGASNA